MPGHRGRAAETISAMVGVVIVAAVIVGAIEYFNKAPDTFSQTAPAAALPSAAPATSGNG
ncbi:MAG: hypothetical protein ACREB8_09915 [Pseudolabrys sp.]